MNAQQLWTLALVVAAVALLLLAGGLLRRLPRG